jgi:hypothetical protein
VSDNEKALQSMLDIVGRRAMEIIELPEGEREDHYGYCWHAYWEAGWDTWGDPERAREYADKIVELVRALVKFIEAGGGAPSDTRSVRGGPTEAKK